MTKFEVGKKYKRDDGRIYDCLYADRQGILLRWENGIGKGYPGTVDHPTSNYLKRFIEYKIPVIHKRYVTWIGNGPELYSIITSYRHTRESLREEYEGTFLRCDEVTYQEEDND